MNSASAPPSDESSHGAALERQQPSPAGAPREVFLAFLKLGLTCFGGPIAHLGYFRAEFVERRCWLSEHSFVDVVALAQFLPGPASSQTGFAIGLMRGGYLGGVAAWVGFTLPSAILMFLFAYGAGRITDSAWGAELLHGLKLVAVAIVAQALFGMAKSLCPDRERASIAIVGLFVLLFVPGAIGQIGTILFGALAGLVLCRGVGDSAASEFAMPMDRRAGVLCLAVFFVLLGFSFVPIQSFAIALFDAFYRSGALVFGGGHVVLPLLRTAVVVPGWVSDSDFLAGYGAAQAMPGPLFTFATYLGTVANGATRGPAGALIGLFAIFVPGILALMGTLPFWHGLRARPGARAAMAGINAAVVGLLGAALYNPLWTSAVSTPVDFAIVAAAFVLLMAWRAPPLVVVAACAAAGAAATLIR